MRLTLRTMLAYLEGVLDATDAEQLAHRIEESEDARRVMHRTRDVTRRLKLGAPKLDGRGLGSDPNTVSEYLDNTLQADRVPEFEKICLESDVHLAEVASVHQILALVLGEQAEFDPAMRKRMYKLVEEADAIEAEAAKPVQQFVSAGAHQPAKPRRKPEVPDYLRIREPRNYVPWVLAAAVLVCLGAGSMLFVNRGGMDLLVAKHDPNGAEVPAPANDAQTHKVPNTTFPGGLPPEDSGNAATAPGGNAATGPTGDEATGVVPGEAGVADDGAGGVAPGQDDAAAPVEPGMPADEQATEPAPGGNPGAGPAVPAAPQSLTKDVPEAFQTDLPPLDADLPANPGGAPAVPAPAPTPTQPPKNDPTAPQPGPPAAADVKAGATADAATPKSPPPRPMSVLEDDALRPAVAPAAAAAAPGAAPVVGRLASDSEVLIRPSGPDRNWTRLSTRDTLAAENELIALPTFRPSITFNTPNGATAQLLGGTVARLIGPNGGGVPGIHVIDGQVVLLTAGRPGTQLQLQVADKVYLVTFVDPDSTLAVEVRRIIPEGGDPIRDPARTTAEVIVSSGVVDIGPVSGGKHEALTVPDRKMLVGVASQEQAASNVNATLPAWIVGTTPNQNDKRATTETERLLTIGEPVSEALQELTHERRVEFRNLAVLALTTMGEFSAFLPSLNDPMQKANWNAQIDAARRAIARNHQTAKALKATFESERDARQAADLYKLLCGVSRQELLAGSDRWLVTELDNDEMDFRVLAFWNLRQFSVGTLDYHPEHNTAKKRAVGVRAWKLRSDARQIVPKS